MFFAMIQGWMKQNFLHAWCSSGDSIVLQKKATYHERHMHDSLMWFLKRAPAHVWTPWSPTLWLASRFVCWMCTDLRSIQTSLYPLGLWPTETWFVGIHMKLYEDYFYHLIGHWTLEIDVFTKSEGLVGANNWSPVNMSTIKRKCLVARVFHGIPVGITFLVSSLRAGPNNFLKNDGEMLIPLEILNA